MEDDLDSVSKKYKNTWKPFLISKFRGFFEIIFKKFSKFDEKVQRFVFTYDPNNLP